MGRRCCLSMDLPQGLFHLSVLCYVSEGGGALKIAASTAIVPSESGLQPTAQPDSVYSQATTALIIGAAWKELR